MIINKNIVKLLYICIVSSIMLVGCGRYWLKRPVDYHNTVWISEEPYLEISVDKDGYAVSKMKVDNCVEEVAIRYRDSFVACDPIPGEEGYVYANMYFRAECKCSKKKCIMKITEKREGILEGVDEIVLYNQKYVDKKK